MSLKALTRSYIPELHAEATFGSIEGHRCSLKVKNSSSVLTEHTLFAEIVKDVREVNNVGAVKILDSRDMSDP